jgi:hypothetical protein
MADAAATRVIEFYRRRVSQVQQEAALLRQGTLLHDTLCQATFAVPAVDVQRRRASMCHDGTPILYSLELTRSSECPAFRMLVEPGGVGLTVAEQINHSLRVADILLHRFGWQSAVDDLNSIAAFVFPKDSATVNQWWGGIWLGADMESRRNELRLYLNLRYGEAQVRWQRVADVLAWFGDESLVVPFDALHRHAAPQAIPVGMGIVVAEGRIRGLRLYAGLHEPGISSILSARPDQFSGADDDIRLLCDTFTARFGAFVRQSVTLGYDFSLDEAGQLQPNVARTKIDVSCQHIPPAARPALVPMLEDLSTHWELDATLVEGFLQDLDSCFGGRDIEYFSVGFRARLDHATIYAKPHGYALS